MRPSEVLAYNIQRLSNAEGSEAALARRLGVPQAVLNRWGKGQGAKRLDAIYLRFEEAGIDPGELRRLPTELVQSPDLEEIACLWRRVSPQTRLTILHMARLDAGAE